MHSVQPQLLMATLLSLRPWSSKPRGSPALRRRDFRIARQRYHTCSHCQSHLPSLPTILFVLTLTALPLGHPPRPLRRVRRLDRPPHRRSLLRVRQIRHLTLRRLRRRMVHHQRAPVLQLAILQLPRWQILPGAQQHYRR